MQNIGVGSKTREIDDPTEYSPAPFQFRQG